MYRYVLFDLDGTLTDPKEGICKSVQYALSKVGIDEPDLDALEPFIGPPLKDSFEEFYHLSEEQIAVAIAAYRERFSVEGKFENEIYPGIKNLLADLKKRDRVVAVASSKPTVFVEEILAHFEIREYFDIVVGSELDGTRSQKEEVINETLQRLFPEGNIEYDEVVMVGDRKFDIESALSIGIRNIGVSYGYGSVEELNEAGADKVVHTVEGLRAVLMPMGGFSAESSAAYTQKHASTVEGERKGDVKDWRAASKEASKKSYANIWAMFGPAISYKIGYFAALIALSLVLRNFLYTDAVGSTTENTLSVNANVYAAILGMCSIIPCLFLIKPFRFVSMKDHESGRDKTDLLHPLEPLYNAISILILGVGINGMLYGLYKLSEQTATTVTEDTSAAQTADVAVVMPLVAGLLLMGVVVPACEQFIFTGLTYRRARVFLKPGLSLACATFIYGFLRSDRSDSFIGFIIFGMIVYAFSKYPRVWYAMLVHVVVASVSYVLTYWDKASVIYDNELIPKICIGLGLALFMIDVFAHNKAAIKKED